MAEPVDIRGALDMRPEDAIRAFRARDALKLTVSWRDLEPEEHARAFTVAKVAKLDILAALGGSLDSALKEGQSFEQWRDGIVPALQREGWWGLVQDEDLTGTADPVFVGERRLRTIFTTNMRVSRAAGQWARIQALKTARPWLRYSAVMDSRTRPLHRRWHGLIRPVDDPVWRTIFPPNGWNCRCVVQQLSDRDMARRGYAPTPDDQMPDTGPAGSAWFGPPGARQRRDTARGIDAGWAYNPGTESLRGMAEKARQSIDQALMAGLEEAAQRTLADLVGSAVLDNHLRRPDAAAAIEALRGERGAFFPIAIVPQLIATALRADTRVALFSAATWGKQLANHAELGREFYAGLARISRWRHRSYLLPDRTVRVFADTDEGLIRMVFKQADDGREIFLVSVHSARPRDEAATAAASDMVENYMPD